MIHMAIVFLLKYNAVVLENQWLPELRDPVEKDSFSLEDRRLE
jgi:hypothetical protein